jgi:histidyl-tRNA synthetase
MKKTSRKVPAKTKKGSKEKKETIPSSERSAEIALYYGFRYLNSPVINKEDIQKTKKELQIDIKETKEDTDPLIPHADGKVALLRLFTQHDMFSWNQPVMLYYEGALKRDAEALALVGESRNHSHPNEHIFHLDILGAGKSVAEAILIKTAFEILREEGYKNLIVHINSIGDKDSVARFCRELTNYYRKHIETLSPHCRQAFKKDPFGVLECTDQKCEETCREIKEAAPNPVSYLSEPSRAHFREVLEYLETLGLPYQIENKLICDRSYWSQTAFEIREEETDELLASGFRYNQMSKKIGFKKELAGAGISVRVPRKAGAHKEKSRAITIKNPKIYFIQLGYEAKLKSLLVIEMLRQAKIPMTQAISRDKIGGQIQSAENSKIPYTIIMGQKEAMENTVIVREMATRSQEIVSLAALPEYLKKIK